MSRPAAAALRLRSVRTRRARARPTAAGLAVIASLPALLGCDVLPAPPGKPTEADRFVVASRIVDFDGLYTLHCSGCHGADGTLGPARALNDPLYLALIPTPVLERTIRVGVAGTPMPAFGHAAGGPLSDAQVTSLVEGLTRHWGGEAPSGLPAYAAAGAGDPQRGRAAFDTFCAGCHGADGRGGEAAGSVVDAAYLGVVSDQGLRTSVIVGRRDLDMPDYRSDLPDRVMSAREIDDVVAWLVAQRPRHPGQPYPSRPQATAPRAAGERPRREPASSIADRPDAGVDAHAPEPARRPEPVRRTVPARIEERSS